jgi:hypothetical protein
MDELHGSTAADGDLLLRHGRHVSPIRRPWLWTWGQANQSASANNVGSLKISPWLRDQTGSSHTRAQRAGPAKAGLVFYCSSQRSWDHLYTINVDDKSFTGDEEPQRLIPCFMQGAVV